MEIIADALSKADSFGCEITKGFLKTVENGLMRIEGDTGGSKIVITINGGDHDIIRNLDTGNCDIVDKEES